MSYLERFQEYLPQVTRTVQDATLREMVECVLDLVHPSHGLLAYRCTRVAGGDDDLALPVAALALLTRAGLATLDDYQDGDADAYPWPLPEAANVVVALLGLGHYCFSLLPSVVAPRIQAEQAEFGQMMLKLCAGQQRELVNREALTLEEYESLILAKSVPFIQWEATAGARMLMRAELAGVLGRFGYHTGYLYQLTNDLMGFLNVEKSDLCRHWTWPTVYAWEVSSPDERRVLADAWARGDREAVRETAIERGALAFLMALVVRHRQQALSALSELPSVEAESLREFVDHYTPLLNQLNTAAIAPEPGSS